MILSKKIFIKLFVVLISVVFFRNFSFAQISTQQLGGSDINTITTAVPFLLISPDSRSGAMGDVGVAISPDANSIHWNPQSWFLLIHLMMLVLVCLILHG